MAIKNFDELAGNTPFYDDTTGKIISSIVPNTGGASSIAQRLVVNKNPSAGEYSLISSALASITDNTASKPYVIYVASGVYTDNFTMKPYVSVVGESYTSTIIESGNANANLVTGADQSTISNVTLRGSTGSGFSAIYYSSSSGITTAVFNVENVRFGANNILVKSVGTGGQTCIVQCTNVKYGGTGSAFDTGFWATYDGVSGASTIQLRSVTTTNGSIISPITVFAKADGASCQIVCNSAQVNKSGTTEGIAFQAINGGSLRLTSVNIRNWGKGIDMPNTGSATNISGVGLNFENNTEDVNVAHTSATGKIENADYQKTTIVDTASVFVLNTDVQTIKVRKKGGDYDSIASAIADITDSSASKIYKIDVGAGVFIEPLIDLSSKPYINIEGSTINTTIIQPDANNHHVFKLGLMNELSFLTIENAGSGFAGIYATDFGNFVQLHKITFNNCDTGIFVENTTIDSEFYGEYIDFAGAMTYGIRVLNNGSGTLFVNAENCYCFPTSGLNTCYLITGANADFHLELSGNEFTGVSPTGKGVEWHTGANIDVMSAYFYNFVTAISMPNTGATPTGHFISVKTEDCTTDISIQHTTGQGSFQGAMDNPVISIATTATFGIQYLESLLGNKRELYFDASSFNLVAGATPTTSASTRGTLTATGFTLLTFGGTTNSDAGASVNFRIPKDYLRNGRFKIIWTSATGTNNIKWQFIVTKKSIGQNMATTTETGLSVIVQATTQYNLNETDWVASTTTYSIGDTVAIRVYRLGNDASDTFTGDAYISGLLFEYEGSK